MNASTAISTLKLLPHPEGGYYRETYRDDTTIILPDGRIRNVSTAIYYLLQNDNKSHFHRIQSDEIWFYHSGKPLSIYVIENNRTLTKHILGANIELGHSLQVVIKATLWFAAKISDEEGYTLVSCTVAPGFTFDDFEIASKTELLDSYPEHQDIIREMCL